jgi:hypothetical protein
MTKHQTNGALLVALLAAFALACNSKTIPTIATSGDATITTKGLSTAPTSTPPQTTPGVVSFTTSITPPPIPAELHYSPADIKYLNSLDPDARALAIRRAQEDLAAIREAGKLSNGYTDSLKHWSISTAKKAR